MKDQEHIVPLLHKLDHPTFFTRDLGFFDQDRCHDGYCLVCLDVNQKDAAHFVRRFLRPPSFNTKAKRMGTVLRASPTGLSVWRSNASKSERIPWRRSRRA
jgi:hypothetical protein